MTELPFFFRTVIPPRCPLDGGTRSTHKFSVIPFWQLSRSITANWSCDAQQAALMLAVPRRDFHPAQEEISGTRCVQGRDTSNPTLFTPGFVFSPSNLLQELIFPLEEGKQRSCFNYHPEQRIPESEMAVHQHLAPLFPLFNPCLEHWLLLGFPAAPSPSRTLHARGALLLQGF